MPKFKPEDLQVIKKLYSLHLGYIPPLIENAEEVEMQLLQQHDFTKPSHSFFATSTSNDPRFTGISKEIILLLRSVNSSWISNTNRKKEYCSPNLLLREFEDWMHTRDIGNPLQEIIDVDKRFALLEALFSTENLLEFSSDILEIIKHYISFFGKRNVSLNNYKLHESINKEAETLAQNLLAFNECYKISDEISAHLSKNFDEAIDNLANDFDNLSKVFKNAQKKKAFIEEDFYNLRLCLALIVCQINNVKKEMGTISLYHQCKSLMPNEEGIKLTAQINSSIEPIIIGIDMINRKSGPELHYVGDILQYKGFPDVEEEQFDSESSISSYNCD